MRSSMFICGCFRSSQNETCRLPVNRFVPGIGVSKEGVNSVYSDRGVVDLLADVLDLSRARMSLVQP